MLKLEAEVAQAIVNEIQIALTPEEHRRIGSARRVNPAAHDAYWLGRSYYWRNNETDFKRAVEHYRQAITLQPDYADAHAALAMVLGDLGETEESRKAAEKALELDPNLAEAHAAMANVHFLDWNWEATDNEYKRAMELNPNSIDACGCYAQFLAQTGHIDEALELIDHAVAVNPLSSVIQQAYGTILYFARRYPDIRMTWLSLISCWVTRNADRMVDQVFRYPPPPGALGKIRSRTGPISFRAASSGPGRAPENA